MICPLSTKNGWDPRKICLLWAINAGILSASPRVAISVKNWDWDIIKNGFSVEEGMERRIFKLDQPFAN